TVPDLRGFTIREASEVLSWLGLRLEVEGSGIAISQQPEAGSEVKSGTAVKVVFGSPLDP
ncbi:MAG TPA: PASTA domain-containing protein, partial [Bacillota bacterium]|nr:PASTA domain-containing protein [Bacillota bacterium]